MSPISQAETSRSVIQPSKDAKISNGIKIKKSDTIPSANGDKKELQKNGDAFKPRNKTLGDLLIILGILVFCSVII